MTAGCQISSFFEVFTEISVDGGVNWYPSLTAPGRLALAAFPPVVLTGSTNITVTATGPGGAVVFYTISASGGCNPPPTVVANPPQRQHLPGGDDDGDSGRQRHPRQQHQLPLHRHRQPADSSKPGVFLPTARAAANRKRGDQHGDLYFASYANGIVIGEYVCSGYTFSANCGWIHLGSNAPANGIQYQNNSATDYGVNHDGLGNLRGYANGANIGWVNFESTGAPSVDLITGKFSGSF